MRMPVRALQLTAVILLVAAPLAGQEDPAQGGPAGPPPPPTELVFEREVFQYPAFERRNPFRALVGTLAGGPRSEQISLRGIIWSAEPGRSVALFGTGIAGAAPSAEGGPSTKRLRVGETWGNTTVVEIERDLVVVQVEEFGLTERKVFQLTRR